MMEKNIRLTGIASIAAGLFLFSGGVLHQVLHNPFGHWIMYLGDILMVFALTGIYAIQAHQSGWIGLVGYVLSVFGWMVLSISAFIVLAEVTGQENAHDMFMHMYFNLSLYLPGLYAALLGLALIGLATAYSGVLPRYAGLLLVLGAISDFPAEIMMPLAFMYYISIFLSMIGLVWIGFSLVRRNHAVAAVKHSATPLPSLE